MKDFVTGPSHTSRQVCRRLLHEEQPDPSVMPFSGDNQGFSLMCNLLGQQHEVTVIQNILSQLVPPVAMFSANALVKSHRFSGTVGGGCDGEDGGDGGGGGDGRGAGEAEMIASVYASLVETINEGWN